MRASARFRQQWAGRAAVGTLALAVSCAAAASSGAAVQIARAAEGQRILEAAAAAEGRVDLLHQVAELPIGDRRTLAQLLPVGTDVAAVLGPVLDAAPSVGGPRWLDDRTCQIKLQLSGDAVFSALTAAGDERTTGEATSARPPSARPTYANPSNHPPAPGAPSDDQSTPGQSVPPPAATPTSTSIPTQGLPRIRAEDVTLLRRALVGRTFVATGTSVAPGDLLPLLPDPLPPAWQAASEAQRREAIEGARRAAVDQAVTRSLKLVQTSRADKAAGTAERSDPAESSESSESSESLQPSADPAADDADANHSDADHLDADQAQAVPAPTNQADAGRALELLADREKVRVWANSMPVTHVAIRPDDQVEVAIYLDAPSLNALARAKGLAGNTGAVAPLSTGDRPPPPPDELFASMPATSTGLGSVPNATPARPGDNPPGNKPPGDKSPGDKPPGGAQPDNEQSIKEQPVPAPVWPARAPAWVRDPVTAAATAPRDRNKLRAAREAEAMAIAVLKEKLQALPIDSGRSLGAVAAKDRPTRALLDQAVAGARVYKVDYLDDGSVRVSVSIDSEAFWSRLTADE